MSFLEQTVETWQTIKINHNQQEAVMKKQLLTLIILVAALALTSCVTVRYISTGDALPPYEGTVKVFFNQAPEDVKYQEIGIISSKGMSVHHWTELIEKMQEEGAAQGANAIIILDKSKEKDVYMTFSADSGLSGGTSTKKDMLALAIWVE